ncbi:hypothetical protein M758_8G047600 [Ceratodon purpureus]|nr:hypothetical protein M758_8G047600 [Ceratodon purpureus]
MAKVTSSVVILSLFLVAMDSATMVLCRPKGVAIWNKMAANQPPFQVHCRKMKFDKKEVIPETSLRSGEGVQWYFNPSFWGTTLYHCWFKWGAKTQDFDVWYDVLMFHMWSNCYQCEWYVTEEGFSQFEADTFHSNPIEHYSWK